ncbi:MAG TPA: hypothetical protein VI876_13510 [Dehalococcoidia bacterium]|nr:hypothetical protein [Dehalococcoidia bacterium]
MNLDEQQSMQLEWLILADAAQVMGNKLYLMGGGWDTLTINADFPLQHRCAIATSIRVPWTRTNEKHHFEVEISTLDGQSLAKVEGQFEVGRPAGVPQGSSQRFQLAAEIALGLEKPGEFVVVARIEGAEVGRISFRAIEGPALLRKRGAA